ncbi:permease-like cell division protein FtsX [Reinekea marinisedimentorum]|uniref:Cell division protein FtsX n=1 Tax=Reinekea marinisedimentorum TaxID=230495 RepID=A0A4R3HVR7_9GAMM|nr:permease-like cell division protein FtsX [Reinekea marinisedimentorum]TCS37188.1 cell division transport system permease protein [Reinekea marinisedimentorum]
MSNTKKTSNRKRQQVKPQTDIGGWARHHLKCASDAFLTLVRQPISSALTWLVIAIALMLPALFYIMLQAAASQTSHWQEGGQITLYLADATSESAGTTLANELALRPEVLKTEFISKEQAWQSFRPVISENTELQLESNPLPASVVVIPTLQDQADLEALILTLQDLPEINDIQIDLAWIARLNSLLDIARSTVHLLGIILSVAVLLIVGNTIRLSVESRKSEIEITKLLGATDAFVRRPFLYLGAWYGLFGGIAACVLLTLISVNFQSVLEPFLAGYGLSAPAIWLNAGELGTLLFASILVSLAGARIALWRHLRDTDPK